MAKKKCDPKPAPLVKCLICGETLKVTKWRKHLARFHDEVDDPNFRDFFVILKHLSRSKIKCRLCDQVITLTDWEYHLRVKHGLKNDLRLKEFYIGQDSSTQIANKSWYNPQSNENLPCGTIVNGPPPIKIIYNSIFSSRKKF